MRALAVLALGLVAAAAVLVIRDGGDEEAPARAAPAAPASLSDSAGRAPGVRSRPPAPGRS
jgi:hypothetical protein